MVKTLQKDGIPYPMLNNYTPAGTYRSEKLVKLKLVRNDRSTTQYQHARSCERCDPELEHVIFNDIDEQEANVDQLISTWRWRVIPNMETGRCLGILVTH
ncbi:hypothetical protein MKW98_008992 [Papaver atlanticum]|uniref:Uncharacterized protein n=1 Tax=Papaver atlanticum TaxID=357466 RepID=A0AAD4RYA0_9MAGN|nr:hypothetical protein MKW98_008992 [Papaver atlanticum]